MLSNQNFQDVQIYLKSLFWVVDLPTPLPVNYTHLDGYQRACIVNVTSWSILTG